MTLPEGFVYEHAFLSSTDARSLFNVLHAEVDWAQRDIRLFGRQVPQPRLMAWSADAGVRYRYSGLQLDPQTWHPRVDQIRQELWRTVRCRFNSVLLNLYRDGHDSMGWHADDEPELGPEPVIASLSLGATRRLRLRPRSGGPGVGFDLENGSLLLMSGASQALWQHAVPKTKREVGPRINLTFRRVVKADSGGMGVGAGFQS